VVVIEVEPQPANPPLFEGPVYETAYGNGAVRVVDHGAYTLQAWTSEKVVFQLSGEKLRGRFALFHVGRTPEEWLLMRLRE
jgi:bifunctional non-homologous end joining protein LigD